MKNDQVIWVVVAVVVALFLFSGFFGYGNFGYTGMMSGGFFPFMWIFGWLFMLLFLVALILLIAWLIKQLQK